MYTLIPNRNKVGLGNVHNFLQSRMELSPILNTVFNISSFNLMCIFVYVIYWDSIAEELHSQKDGNHVHLHQKRTVPKDNMDIYSYSLAEGWYCWQQVMLIEHWEILLTPPFANSASSGQSSNLLLRCTGISLHPDDAGSYDSQSLDDKLISHAIRKLLRALNTRKSMELNKIQLLYWTWDPELAASLAKLL